MAPEYFACPDVPGAEFENDGGTGSAGSHFEKRVLFNEFMSHEITPGYKYRAVLLAALDDSGWYTVAYVSGSPNTYHALTRRRHRRLASPAPYTGKLCPVCCAPAEAAHRPALRRGLAAGPGAASDSDSGRPLAGDRVRRMAALLPPARCAWLSGSDGQPDSQRQQGTHVQQNHAIYGLEDHDDPSHGLGSNDDYTAGNTVTVLAESTRKPPSQAQAGGRATSSFNTRVTIMILTETCRAGPGPDRRATSRAWHGDLQTPGRRAGPPPAGRALLVCPKAQAGHGRRDSNTRAVSLAGATRDRETIGLGVPGRAGHWHCQADLDRHGDSGSVTPSRTSLMLYRDSDSDPSPAHWPRHRRAVTGPGVIHWQTNFKLNHRPS